MLKSILSNWSCQIDSVKLILWNWSCYIDLVKLIPSSWSFKLGGKLHHNPNVIILLIEINIQYDFMSKINL